MRKILHSRVAAVSVGATVLVGFGATGAVAANMIDSSDIRNGSVHAADIARGAVGSNEINNNSVDAQDIVRNSIGESELKPNSVGADQLTGWASNRISAVNGLPKRVSTLEDGVAAASEEIEGANSLVAHASTDWAVVQNIGGSIGARKTDMVKVDLRPGAYMVNVDGAFIYPKDATPHSGTDLYPQLSLWVDQNNSGTLDWDAETGGEGSISPNTLMPALVDRHVSVSGSTLLTITEEQAGQDGTAPVLVSAFGYAADQGTAGAGQLQATAELNVVEVELP